MIFNFEFDFNMSMIFWSWYLVYFDDLDMIAVINEYLKMKNDDGIFNYCCSDIITFAVHSLIICLARLVPWLTLILTAQL